MPSKPRVFIDTNIALDLLQAREPFVFEAIQLFALAEDGSIELCISTDALSTIFYIVEKDENATKAREALSKLLDYVTLCALDDSSVLAGMALDFEDIEDAFVCSVAQKSNADVIVTRNQGDFANSPIPVQAPSEFLASWKASRNIP